MSSEKIIKAMLASMSDEELAECGLMRLPTDGDGEPICIGDEAQWPNGEWHVVFAIGDHSILFLDKMYEDEPSFEKKS